MRIVMIEDHALFRDGMRLLLGKLDDETEIVEAGGSEEILNGDHWTPPDLLLIDLGLPGLNGVDAVRSLHRFWPEVPLIVLSGENDVDTIRIAIGAGARGFVPKSANAQEMIAALKLVIAGGMYVPTYAREAMPTSKPVALTARQKAVLGQLALGRSNREIATELEMAESTVRGHVSDLLTVLDASNRTEAARIAFEQGLV